MYTPKLYVKNYVSLSFSADTKIIGMPTPVCEMFKKFAVKKENQITEIRAVKGLEQSKKNKLIELKVYEKSPINDGFVIETNGTVVTVYADSDNGIINGAMTFLHLLCDGEYNYKTVYDMPIVTARGVKLMMPSRDEIDDFKDFIDLMMYFRHNAVMIEIGGAMEYKRHPEINEGWEEYAKDMFEYSGKSGKIQESFPWRKNSIHANNGGGSYLTQEEVKDLIKYCNERGITVVPEVPSTSHCDYMLTRHKDLAERPEDPYPDTFCPSNPKSYELLFDILDEVIEVFNPEIINVGHDEYYSINVCDRCRKRLIDNADLFAEDLTKIHDYLASKNVKTMFWCDKLLDVHTVSGANFGGALNYVYEHWNTKGKLLGIIRPTWEARFKIPKDIVCFNWFWSYGSEHDEALREFPVLFGNFHGEVFEGGFLKRSGNNTSGAFCSNWGATSPVYLQRNNIYFGLAYNEKLFWQDGFNDTDAKIRAEMFRICFDELYAYRSAVLKSIPGVTLEFIHTSTKDLMYKSFCDGEFASGDKYMEKYHLGDYTIAYTDGDTAEIPIILGENIRTNSVKWYGEVIFEKGDDGTPGLTSVIIDSKLKEVAYSTVPMQIDGEVYYKTSVKNPKPEKKVLSVNIKNLQPDYEIKVSSILINGKNI